MKTKEILSDSISNIIESSNLELKKQLYTLFAKLVNTHLLGKKISKIKSAEGTEIKEVYYNSIVSEKGEVRHSFTIETSYGFSEHDLVEISELFQNKRYTNEELSRTFYIFY